MKKVGTSIVGCGNIAAAHAKALTEIEESSLVAVCDLIEGRARTFAQTYAAKKWFTDFEKMIADPEVEAVNICVPHPLHAKLCITAAEKGKHVITEKPMSSSLKGADAMIVAARRSGTKLGVIYQRRFYDASQKVKRAIDAGKIGTPILGEVSCRFHRDRAYYERDTWRGKWSTEGGGVYLNQIIHEIDLFQWFMSNPIDYVYAATANLTHPYVEIEDNAATLVRLQNRGLGVISGSVSANPPLHSRISVLGSNGASVSIKGLDPFSIETWTIKGEETLAEEWRKEQQAISSRTSCHKIQIREFLQAIIEDREPAVTGEEGLKSLEIVIGSYISSYRGGAVKFPVRRDLEQPSYL